MKQFPGSLRNILSSRASRPLATPLLLSSTALFDDDATNEVFHRTLAEFELKFEQPDLSRNSYDSCGRLVSAVVIIFVFPIRC